MSARILILLAIAGGLAAYHATRTASPPTAAEVKLPEFLPASDGETIEDVRSRQLDLTMRDLPGEQPEVPPEFDVRVEPRPEGGKHRLVYSIRERNGFYVETLTINFYYIPAPDAPVPGRPLLTQYFDDYIPANEVRTGCLELVPAEMLDIGHNLGTSANWYAEVVRHGRWRAQNPDPLPPITEWNKCR